jgi:hypothetical protein
MDLPPDVWVAEVSEAHPETTFRLLTGVPADDRSLELGEVTGEDPRGGLEALAAHGDVVTVDALHVDDDRALVRYETTEQALYEFLWGSSLPPQFPLDVRDGRMTFDVTATREQFEALGDRLDAGPFRYELLSVVHAPDGDGLLTDRQQECLRTADRLGYFEVPRRSTLATVAEELGVDTSTASETLRRATARLVAAHLARPE